MDKPHTVILVIVTVITELDEKERGNPAQLSLTDTRKG